MPPEFDPAWEYFVPDRDVEDAIGAQDLLGFQADGFRFFKRSVVRKVQKNRVHPISWSCSRCGVPFKPKAARNGTHTVYCSAACFYDARAEATRARLAAIPTGRCRWCGGATGPRVRKGQLFVRPGSKTKFCSRRCVSHYHAWATRCRKNGRTVKLV